MTQPAASPSIRTTLGFVAFIVFVDMVGIGLIIPVMPALLESITGESVDRTAEIGGYLLFAYAMMQFLFAPVIGGLSDRFLDLGGHGFVDAVELARSVQGDRRNVA